MSTFRKLLSVNAIVAMTLLFGLINNVAITSVFGLNRSVDAYFASLMLIRLFMFLVIDYLGKNFLPVYAARREISADSASDLTSLVITQIGLISMVIAAILIAISKPLFGVLLPGFDDTAVDMTADTFVIMAPCIVLMGINAFHEYVWQHSERFNRVVLARIVVPISSTAFIFGLGSAIGTKALPFGFLCGNLIMAGLMMRGIPYRYRIRVGFADPDFRKILSNSGVLMSTGIIARTRSVIVQYFGSQLGEGAISAISIAQKICNPVFQSALLGIRMILFSRSAKAVARANISAFARMHNQAIVGVFFLTMPIAVWYAFEGDLVVRAVFQRGAFTDDMVILVSAALLGLAANVTIAGPVQMASNAFYALDRIKVPATVMPLGTLLYLLFAVLLTPSLGLLGLSASTSIVSMLVFLVLMWKLKEHVQQLDLRGIAGSCLRYLATAAIAVLASRVLTNAIEGSILLRFAVSIVTVGTAYLVLNWLTGDKILKEIVERSGITQKFGPRNQRGRGL